MQDYSKIAKTYGILERVEAFKSSLLSIKGVTSVQFDLNGYFDDIFQVIAIIGYEHDFSKGLNSFYEQHGKIQKSIVRVANKHGLTRTEDALEDMGEHFYIVFSSSKWNHDPACEYGVFYTYNGHELTAGSDGWAPTRNIAIRLMEYHGNRSLLRGYDLYIKERPRQWEYEPLTRKYNGKVVLNPDYCYWNAMRIGDYVSEAVASNLLSALPTPCTGSSCLQLGEAATDMIDVDGRAKSTYITLKRVAEDVWEYCGLCFRGQNIQTGKPVKYA